MQIDWEKAAAEAVSRLSGMLRFDTTNPPGDELALVQWLAGLLNDEGIETEVLAPAEQRGNLVVRLKGNGNQRPLLLLSHLDVVPAEPQMWTHPPFAGKVTDGYVWGRGAIDSKLTGAVHLQVLLLCHRLGLPLERDLVLVAAADEELGGNFGVKWLAETHPEIFDAEYGLNEAGGFALLVDGIPLYTCQVGEKGSASLDLVVQGRPGHSSVPHGDNPIVGLGEVLSALGQKLPHRIAPSVRAFFEGAAAAQKRPEVAQWLLDQLDPLAQPEALDQLPVDAPTRLMFDAMVRNTCAPTVLEAGLKRNVIPSTARVQLSGRPLPGTEEADFLRQVGEVVGQGVEFQLEGFRPGCEFDHRTPLLDAVAASVSRLDSAAAVVPYMQTGGTDARFLVDRDIAMYGFVPMRYEPGLDFFELCHGHDERVSTANVSFAVQVLFDVVCRLNRIDI